LSLVALMTLLSVFKREVTFIKARSEGAGSGAARGGKHGQLDKQAVEEALRRQFDEEASLVFVPGEEWAGSIEGSGGKSGDERGAGEKKGKDARAELTGKKGGNRRAAVARMLSTSTSMATVKMCTKRTTTSGTGK